MTGKIIKLKIGPILLYGFHGAFKEEQILGKEYKLLISLEYDASKAIKSDDVEFSIDYVEIVNIVRKIVETQKFKLLEKCVYEIKKEILNKYSQKIIKLKIEMIKDMPPVKNVASFSVEI